ncbi:hypothetical protein [Synechococcus elongatus]|nr:hypothetical protein [Synechococcus elongatus]WKW06309.1 hypothetical protein QY054_03810 [Synechococcus elongatus PCC 7942 = FACHB-805]
MRNVSHKGVLEAIQSGRLPSAVKVGQRWEIDPAQADREWSQNTNVNHHKSKAPRVVAEPEDSSLPGLNESKAEREYYLAKLAQLDYEERAGQLVSAEDVRVTWFSHARRVRDAILNVPIRIVDEVRAIAGELDENQRHEILLCLQRELVQALEELAGPEELPPQSQS